MFYKIIFVTTSYEKIQGVYTEEQFITVQYIFLFYSFLDSWFLCSRKLG